MTDKPTITQADRDAAYNFNLYETAASIPVDGEIRRLASYFAKHREAAVAEAEREETCPICEGKKMGLSEGCYAGCRDGRVRWSSANVLKNIKLWWDSDRRSVAELQAEVERLNNAIEKICIESNSDWAKVRDEPRDQIDVIHNIAMDAFFHKHVLAQKEPVE